MSPSGPVFVIDADDQPLMPVAAAHARKLLRTGKAQQRPHHVLTIIQLAHTVTPPILRPILLGIALHQRVAELVAVAAGPRTQFPLMRVVVDLPVVRRVQRRDRAPRRQRGGGRVGARILDIGSVVAALTRVCPLSHIVVLHDEEQRQANADELTLLQRYLAGLELPVVIADQTGAPPDRVPADLYSALAPFLTHPPMSITTLVAKATPLGYHTARRQRLLRSTSAQGWFLGIGVVDTLGLTGIIDPASDDATTVLQVPVAADATGVTWQSVRIPSSTPIEHWPITPVELLPLSSLGQVSQMPQTNAHDAPAQG